MDKITLSERDVEDNNHFLSDGMQPTLKGEPMACLLIDKRGMVPNFLFGLSKDSTDAASYNRTVEWLHGTQRSWR